jgi:hypothetical protein
MLDATKRRVLRTVGAGFGLLPIQQALEGIQQRGVDLRRLRALEVFGASGERLTLHYASRVESLSIWELDSAYEDGLRRRFPAADVRITNSYEEVLRTDERYDFVVVDNAVGPEEHFPLFPGVFRVLSDDAILMVLVIPHANRHTRRRYPNVMSSPHLERRAAFYDTDTPEDIPLDRLVAHYGELAEAAGLSTRWRFSVNRREIHRLLPRATSTTYLVYALRRI